MTGLMGAADTFHKLLLDRRTVTACNRSDNHIMLVSKFSDCLLVAEESSVFDSMYRASTHYPFLSQLRESSQCHRTLIILCILRHMYIVIRLHI